MLNAAGSADESRRREGEHQGFPSRGLLQLLALSL